MKAQISRPRAQHTGVEFLKYCTTDMLRIPSDMLRYTGAISLEELGNPLADSGLLLLNQIAAQVLAELLGKICCFATLHQRGRSHVQLGQHGCWCSQSLWCRLCP